MPGLPFISQIDLETYLGAALDDDRSAIAVDSACQILRDAAGQQIDFVADDVVLLDSDGGDTLLLPELPVVSISSVTGPGGFALVDGIDYVFDKETSALVTKARGARFLRGRQVYAVTYSHGFVTVADTPAGAVAYPSSLRALALTLAARIYDQQLASSESVGGSSITYSVPEALSLSPQEQEILRKVIGVGRRR